MSAEGYLKSSTKDEHIQIDLAALHKLELACVIGKGTASDDHDFILAKPREWNFNLGRIVIRAIRDARMEEFKFLGRYMARTLRPNGEQVINAAHFCDQSPEGFIGWHVHEYVAGDQWLLGAISQGGDWIAVADGVRFKFFDGARCFARLNARNVPKCLFLM